MFLGGSNGGIAHELDVELLLTFGLDPLGWLLPLLPWFQYRPLQQQSKDTTSVRYSQHIAQINKVLSFFYLFYALPGNTLPTIVSHQTLA